MRWGEVDDGLLGLKLHPITALEFVDLEVGSFIFFGYYRALGYTALLEVFSLRLSLRV